jgi:hypothetical protein
MKPCGGAAEMQFFGDGQEIAEMAEVDICIHIRIVSIGTNNILNVLIGFV